MILRIAKRLALLAVLLTTHLAWAQPAQIGTIAGTVTDPEGAAIGCVDLAPFIGPCRVIHAIGCGPLVRPEHLAHAMQQLPPRVLVRVYERMPQDRFDNALPAFAPETVALLADRGVEHLLLDLPSVDREEDGGALAAHRAFWRYPDAVRDRATITEMVFVPDELPDGLYLLNLQVLSLVLDASPSRPVLYPLLPCP